MKNNFHHLGNNHLILYKHAEYFPKLALILIEVCVIENLLI
jgi:hypothetical protein